MNQVEWLEARNGQTTARVTTAQGRKIFVHSRYDPEREAEQWAAQVESGPHALIVVFGLGLGYHLKALLRRIESDKRIIVVEPIAEFRSSISQEALRSEFPDHEKIFVVEDWRCFKNLYERVATNWDNIYFTHLPWAPRVFPEEYRAFAAKLAGEMRSLSANWATTLLRGDLWQFNFLRNCRHLGEAHTARNMFDRFEGKPVFVVSSGPSLSKNIELLHQVKGRALILAVGSSSRLLLKHGITPDLVTTFDGHSNNYENVFQGMPLDGVPLVFDPVTYHKIVEKHRGPRVVMAVHPSNLWLEQFFEGGIGRVQVGGSIANTTFDLAYRLGADPIIFVGQDLAFTNDELYAKGTTNWEVRTEERGGERLTILDRQGTGHGADRVYRARVEWVDGIDGEPVATSPSMLVFLHWFEEAFAAIRGERTIIDATEGGAEMKGSRVMPLQEAIETYCQADLSDEIADFHSELLSKANFDRDGFLESVRCFRDFSREMIPATTRAVRSSKRLVAHFDEGKSCNLRKELARLDRVDRKLKKGKNDFPMIQYLLAPIELIVRYPEETGNEEMDACVQSLRLYAGLKQCLEYSLPLVEDLVRVLGDDIASEEACEFIAPRAPDDRMDDETRRL